MDETFVVKASPIIFLGRAGKLDLLRKLASRVFVPVEVAAEIKRKGDEDAAAIAVVSVPWLEAVRTGKIPPEITAWGLGAG